MINNEKQIENKDKKEYNYIYFNFKFKKNKEYKINFSSDYNAINNLELIKEKDLDNTPTDYLILKIYRFKIIPDFLKKKNKNNEFEIDIFLEEENGTKGQYTFRFEDINKDFYEFNFKIEGINILPLELSEQFEIYSDILINKYNKNHNTKENEDFILSAALFLIDGNGKCDLLFYSLIFLQSFDTGFVQNHLLLFEPKIIKIGQIPDIKLKQIQNVINLLIKNPEKLGVKDEKSRQKIIKSFYSFALYFNLNFVKENINEMFENEAICDYLYDKLKSYRTVLKDLILSKKDIIKLIRKAKKYEQVFTSLFYLGTDCCLFLKIIGETKDFIYKFQIEEMNRNKDYELYDNRIDIEKYVQPKMEDDLSEILCAVEELKICTTMINDDMKLIKFSSLIIEKYLEFYDGIDVDNLIILKNIVDSLKQIDNKFDCKCNLEEKIHATGLKLIKEGKLKNIKILEFIESDVYFIDNRYNHKIYRSLEIFDGIDISLIEDKNKFFEKWKSINFYSIFEAQFDDFLKKIYLLIKEMKDFGYLFQFYRPYLNYKAIIKNLQNRFIELMPTYKENECPNFFEDIVELIFKLDNAKADIKNFLTKIIEKKLDAKIVNNIYINLIKKHKDLSKECTKIIIKFFNEYTGDLNPISLAFLIDKSNNPRKDLFLNINKYIFNQDEIFQREESNNYLFLKELVTRKIIEKVQNKEPKYIEEIIKYKASIQYKINNSEIKYSIVSKFFKEGKQMEEILKERISILFLNDEEGFNKSFEILKSKVLTIKKIIEDFKLICKYFLEFFPNIHTEDINNIQKIIISLEDNNLNYFEKYHKKEYEKYIIYLDDEAKKRLEKKSSEFYNQIYIYSRRIYKEDDLKCIEETENKFDKLRYLFEENGIDKIDEKILLLYSKSFNESKYISLELKKIIKIFKFSKDKNYKFDNIKNDLILISKKEYILNAISSITYFIEQAGVIKGDYSSNIKKVLASLKENNNISSLKQNIKLLKNLGLDFIKEENNYINFLIKLSQKEEIIKFLFNINIEDCHNLKEILSENNYSFISMEEHLDIEKYVEFFKSLGNLDDLKLKSDEEIIKLFKENISKIENKEIRIHIDKFIDIYNKIRDLQSALFESFIKLTKHLKENSSSNLLENLEIDNQLLLGQKIKEKNNINDMNNLRSEKNEILSPDKVELSLIFFFKEGLKFFRTIASLFKNRNYINIIDYKGIYEKKNKEINEINNKLDLELKKEKEINIELSLKIKELETLLKGKEKEINDLNNKINDIKKNFNNNNKIIELLEKRENEIRELKEIFPFECSKEDKIFTVNFLSLNEDIHYSVICKNTDKFYRLEEVFYDKFPEYKKGDNVFLIHGKIIDKYNNLESNNINDNDIIIFKP